jgi:hypothetical protein
MLPEGRCNAHADARQPKLSVLATCFMKGLEMPGRAGSQNQYAAYYLVSTPCQCGMRMPQVWYMVCIACVQTLQCTCTLSVIHDSLHKLQPHLHQLEQPATSLLLKKKLQTSAYNTIEDANMQRCSSTARTAQKIHNQACLMSRQSCQNAPISFNWLLLSAAVSALS